MSVRLEQFVSELVESGLLTPDEQHALVASDGGGPSSDSDNSRIARITEQLVREGRVTEFQLSLLLAGRGRELRLENYLILEKLGEGGMGTVFKAVHMLMRRTVAVKTLRHLATESYAIQRFQQEITALGKLSHPHVVRASHAGQVGGTWFLVMDFVPGVDLTWVSREFGVLRTADACEIVRQTAVGLEYIDHQGLVHRDIKPSNLMLTADGTVRILDLGLARLREDKSDNGRADNRRLTAAGQILGTVDYIAPEQASGDANVDIRADIYSLGCTLFRLLTGHVPYCAPRYPGKMERILAHVNDPFPDIRTARPDLAPSLVAILQRMVAKQPSERFPTPAELELVLRPFCDGANLPALLASAQRSVDVTSPTILAPAPGPADPQIDTVAAAPSTTPRLRLARFRPRWKALRGALLPLSGAAVLILVGVLVAVMLSRKAAQQGPPETTGGHSEPPPEIAADTLH